jgi:uncharacterized protein (TIGR02231 family)
MEAQVPYSLTDVTVYPDRAQVTCSGETKVSPEIDTIILDDLPLSMEEESVRISGTGSSVVQILSVDVVQEHYVQSPSTAVQNLEAEIEAVNEELLAVEDEIVIWQAEADQLKGLRQATAEYAKGLSRGRISVEDQKDLMVYIRTQDRAVKTEQRNLDSQARELRRKLEKLQKDLAALDSAKPRSRYQVRVSVNVEGDGRFVPVLTYVVRNAYWRPLYDLHYASSGDQGKDLSISTIAQVSQRTGQEWSDVQLKVSTARPALNQRLPELKPWYIDSFAPPPTPIPKEKQLGVAMSRHAVLAESAAGEVTESVQAFSVQMADAVVQNENAVVTYQVSGSCTVESDGSPHKFFLGKFYPQAGLTYLSIPKHTDAVFRMIKLVNDAASPLLSGQGNLFFDDEYIGNTRIDYTPLNGELELLLGVEERIEVERELTKRSVDKKLLKDDRVISYGFEITLKNLLDHLVDVELRDQLPVSRHEEIQVKLDEAKPAPSERTDMNILEWHVKMEPEMETVVRYGFTVQYPRSMNIVGLRD